MTRIILVRHGHVEGIKPERFRGRRDVPLSRRGHLEAASVALAITERWPIGEVFTSPMGRCTETAIVIGRPFEKKPVVLDSLNDLDYGEWQWLTHREAKALSPSLFKLWLSAPDLVRFPGGESLQDLAARAADALRRIVEANPQRTVAVVSHDSVNRAILTQALAQPLSAYWRIAQSPCGVNEIEVEEGRIRVLRVNETAHLENL